MDIVSSFGRFDEQRLLGDIHVRDGRRPLVLCAAGDAANDPRFALALAPPALILGGAVIGTGALLGAGVARLVAPSGTKPEYAKGAVIGGVVAVGGTLYAIYSALQVG